MSRDTVLVDGYVGSSQGPRSIELHHGLLRLWATERGWRMGRIHDESSLSEALERIESHESDGLVVTRFSHLGPSLDAALAAIERIQAAGGRFVSVYDRIDLDTPIGKQVLRILLSLAIHTPEGTRQ